jgi:hypothetical protein
MRWFIVILSGLAALLVTTPLLAGQAGDPVGNILTPGQSNEWGMAFIWAIASSGFLQWLKMHPKITLMSEDATRWANRRVAILLAVFSAIGVHTTFDATAGVLTVTGLTLPGIWTALGDAIRQYALQQFTYRAAIEE